MNAGMSNFLLYFFIALVPISGVLLFIILLTVERIRRKEEEAMEIERIKKIYENKAQIPDTPELLFRVLEEQKVRLMQAKEKFGDYITPSKFLS